MNTGLLLAGRHHLALLVPLCEQRLRTLPAAADFGVEFTRVLSTFAARLPALPAKLSGWW